jgi:hypothetical protein
MRFRLKNRMIDSRGGRGWKEIPKAGGKSS